VYEAISLIVGNSAQDVSSLIGDLFLEFLSRLEQAFNMSTFSTDEKMRKEEMQGMLAGCINVCIGKIDPDLVNEQSDYLMQMLVALLSEEENSAADEAVLAIGQVASALESEFDRHMELLLEPLKKGLSDPSLHHLCSVSAGLIGDIARALDADVRQYSDDFAQSLLNLMHSEPHPSTRPLVIAAFSDLAMSLGGDFGDYVTYVMEVLTPVVEEVIEQGRALAEGEELEDEDEIEQLAELRESLLDVFTGMVQALRDGEKADKLEGDVELIVAFMGSVVEDMQYQTLAHLKQIVGLVGDLGLAFGRPVGPILDKAWLKGLLEETATYEECEEAVEFTESVLSKIFK
jgi:importin subunit beta-1